MKAIAYSINADEKEYLVKSNAKYHDLTLISNELNAHTLAYCIGKTVVIISPKDQLDAELLTVLHENGVRHIITRSRSTDHIDLKMASSLGIKIANNPTNDQSLENTAKQTIRNLNLWEAGKCVGKACCCFTDCSKPIGNDQNFHTK